MKKKIIRFLFVIFGAVSVVLLSIAVRHRLSGKVEAPVLPSPILARVDEIRLYGKDSCFLILSRDEEKRWHARSGTAEFRPDASRVEDFLHLFGLWEIAEIPTDSQRSEWRSILSERGGRLMLKAGNRTVLKFDFGRCGDRFFIRQGRKTYYGMQSVWQPSSWPLFFEQDLSLWRNRILLDWDYDQIASVSVDYDREDGQSYVLKVSESGDYDLIRSGRTDTIDRRIAQNYLAAFRQVYFSPAPDSAVFGICRCSVRICPIQGECTEFRVYDKIGRSGNPDLFKALILLKRDRQADTVEIPYVVLDKMLKTGVWFDVP